MIKIEFFKFIIKLIFKLKIKMQSRNISKIFNDPDNFKMKDFEIIEEIGKGAFSTVFEAIQDNKFSVALKIINLETMNSEHLKLL